MGVIATRFVCAKANVQYKSTTDNHSARRIYRIRKEIHALQAKVEALSAAPQSKQAKSAAHDANIKAQVRSCSLVIVSRPPNHLDQGVGRVVGIFFESLAASVTTEKYT